MKLVSPFVDLRLKKSGELLFDRMVRGKTVVLKRLASNAAEKKRFERFIRHKEVTTPRIISTEKSRIHELVKGRHILGIQDTTEINYKSSKGRVHGLGTVGNGIDPGFFMHPLLAVDACSGSVIGCAEIELWNRTEAADESYPKLPIEEKESYRWLSTAQGARKVLSPAACVTFISDRESDIYEMFARIPNENTHLLIRTCRDRIIKNSRYRKLYEHLEYQAEAGRIKIQISDDTRSGRKKREATLVIKHSVVEIVKPGKCTDKSAPKTIQLTVVEAREEGCPQGQEPVHWRLFTTHTVSDFTGARQIILWYQMRWIIEQVFRTMKLQGLDTEESQVESGANLMKMAVLALCAAVKIMQLISARDGNTELQTGDTFSAEEQLCMELLIKKLEGKSQKQKNPHPKNNLAWAAWIIARLGGWHGYTKSEGPPGPIVMGCGLRKFYEMFAGWCLYKDTSTG